MKKNGFTLVEISAVLVLVAAIAIITVPSIINYINQSKDEISEVTEKLIFTGVDLYVDNNKNIYVQDPFKRYFVSLNEVVESGLLEAPIIDSVSGEEVNLNKCVKIDYKYDSHLKIYTKNLEIVDECDGKPYICVAATDDNVTGGIVPKGKYNFGDEYKCNFGDGNLKTFYVLENGDTTSLTDSTERVAQQDEISLILDRNYDGEMMTWCDQYGENSSSKVCNGDGLTDKLSDIKEDWTSFGILNDEQINIPSAYQLVSVIGKNNWNGVDLQKGLPNWLYDNVEGTKGYWTSTSYKGPNNFSWIVYFDNRLLPDPVGRMNYYGIRPIITISKEDINSYE